MVEYQKYMFDNFIVGEEEEKNSTVDSNIDTETVITTEYKDDTDDEKNMEATVEDTTDNSIDESGETEIEENEVYTNPMPVFSFTQEDVDDAVAKAKEAAYAQGLLAAQDSEATRQTALLEEIKNQLSLTFATIQQNTETMEFNALKFLAAALHKLLPTLEQVDNIPEVKKFLDDNFAQLSSQKSLSFFFHPDTAKQAAPFIEKLAAHNDFEGKIAIHKDDNLGLSDCRIEWKDGYAERNTAKLLEKLQELLNNNQQERENG